ncbi:MAG: beta-galactosidase [Chloroflexota bacterium]|nr:beta-galactosidase [Chloroflexota bacterium]
MSNNDGRFGIPGVPFPVGVEYYRAPVPKPELWDEDFARIRAGGMRVIRTFNYWNHLEPRPGLYETDDIDLLFDLAHKHDLRVWLDLPLATHGACPEWLTREHPDMRVVSYRGHVSLTGASPAYPQGSQIHCYDHPAWREYGENLLRYMIGRYKDHPALLVWGLWDGIALSAAWSKTSDGLPCYCPSTLARYDAWLRERFTLDELNARVHRRYRRWEDVQPPRSNQNVVEMLLYKQFHYENLAGHLQWVMDVANDVDPVHEKRSHGAWYPRPQDTVCAPVADSWGMSMSSNNLLTSEDPYKLSERAFGYDWSRSIGKNNRWWNEEIYSGMSRGGVTWRKQSAPEEPTMLLWMCLASGGAGAMYWQYRPEYFSFESPGYNLIALDGEPTARWRATSEALCQMAGMEEHLPLRCDTADVAVVYHGESQELFSYNDEDDRYLDDVRGVHRTLWANGIPVDIVSPGMDWSPYRLIYLTNAAMMTDELRRRIEQTLSDNPDVQLVADGSFGLYSADGQSSYGPPEGFSERFGVRVADFNAITEGDIDAGRNVLQAGDGTIPISTPCGYAVLEPKNGATAIASLDGETVAVRSPDGRFTWWGLSLSAGFGNAGHPDLVLPPVRTAGIEAPLAIDGSGVVPVVRGSANGGDVAFLFNLERSDANVTVRPHRPVGSARNLLAKADLPLRDGGFEISIPAWKHAVVHLA